MLRTIDHVNIVVSDMDRMLDFYTSVLGLQATERGLLSGPWIEAVVGLPDVEAEFVSLEAATSGCTLQLLSYICPAGLRPGGLGQPNVPGLRHLAFAVAGIEGTVESLRRAGVRFTSAVQTVPGSDDQMQVFIVYFHDPEDNLLELCESRRRPQARRRDDRARTEARPTPQRPAPFLRPGDDATRVRRLVAARRAAG